MSKRIPALTLMFFTLVAPTFAQTLKLASTPWLPFTGEKGGPRIVIDLVQEALTRAGINSTVKIVREGTLTPQIKARAFDGSPAMWHDKERERFLEFSAPILENRLLLVGKKGSDVSAKNLDALQGKRIGIVEGYAYGDAVMKTEKAIFARGANHHDNLEKLLRGELDYVLIEDLILTQLLRYQAKDIKDKLEIGSTPLLSRLLHFAIRKDIPNAADIIEKFNSQIKIMLTDGTYNRMTGMNWISVDADGDGKPELVPLSGHVGKEPPDGGYSVFASNGGDEAANTQYWIDGTVYTDWARVPARYKVDMEPAKDPGKPLMQFKF